MELKCRYVDVDIERYQALTGDAAIHIDIGWPYAQLELARGVHEEVSHEAAV